jgi:nucleotide-binding universal stress UspA family protein
MLNNLLLGYDDSDGSRTALAQAIDIAEAAGSWIHLVHVDETDRQDVAGLITGPADDGTAAVQAAEAGLDESERRVEDRSNVMADAVETCHDAHIRCTQRQLFGNPGERLAHIGRLCSVVVVGQRRPPGRDHTHRIGPNINHLLRHCSVPLMVCDTNYQRLDAIQVLCWDDATSGRAVSMAATLCATVNTPLQVEITDIDARETDRISHELEYALKGFHIEHEIRSLGRTAVEAMAIPAKETTARWVVLGYPATVWPWQPSPLKIALSTPNLVRVFVP